MACRISVKASRRSRSSIRASSRNARPAPASVLSVVLRPPALTGAGLGRLRSRRSCVSSRAGPRRNVPPRLHSGVGGGFRSRPTGLRSDERHSPSPVRVSAPRQVIDGAIRHSAIDDAPAELTATRNGRFFCGVGTRAAEGPQVPVTANQEIKGPASGAMYLECANRDGEALVQDGIQLHSLGGRLLKYTPLP
jgi:hypothetical protein